MIEDLAAKIQAVFDNPDMYPGQLEGAIVDAIREKGYTYTLHNEFILIGNGEKYLLSVNLGDEEVEFLWK